MATGTAAKCEHIAAVRILEVPMVATHPEYSAEKVRGAAIILRRRWQRTVFMAGLFGGVVLLALWLIFGL
jgi:hypothetical protein